MPTDTIYGIVASAFCPEAVEKVYQLKKRDRKKPCIVLISHPRDLKLFGLQEVSYSFWPGPVSVIMKGSFPDYLSRGGDTLAFRVPRNFKMLKKTGPLIAPSANPEGLPPAENIKQARAYFKDGVDFYLPGRPRSKNPSILVEIIR